MDNSKTIIMENKINIAELLKDCPKGMELDCTMFDGVEFDSIVDDSTLPIRCRILNPDGNGYNIYNFTKYGYWNTLESAKCVIFPKGKTTWEGFQRPFKDGDIVFYNDTVAIFKEWGDETLFRTYVTKYLCCDSLIDTNVPLFGKSVRKEIRFATNEEKQKLFQAIKEHGYKWNPETKTLEKLIKPKFKVGDRVKSIYNSSQYDITELTDTHYTLVEVKNKFQYTESIIEDKNWELVPNKFDITTLKPFESRVLVRINNDNKWGGAFFSNIDGDFHSHCYKFVTTAGKSYPKMIPYEGNEHLLGTTNDCDEFYKTWE